MSVKNVFLVIGCAFVLSACGKGPNPAVDIACEIDGTSSFVAAAPGASTVTSFVMYITYEDDNGATLGYSNAEFTVISPTDDFRPCLGALGTCTDDLATRQLETKANDQGIGLFEALVTAGDTLAVDVPVFLFGNLQPDGCEIPYSLTYATP